MITEDVLDLYEDTELRQHIIDQARALTNNRLHQTDLIGQAWYMLGKIEAQKTCEYYKEFTKHCMAKELEEILYE